MGDENEPPRRRSPTLIGFLTTVFPGLDGRRGRITRLSRRRRTFHRVPHPSGSTTTALDHGLDGDTGTAGDDVCGHDAGSAVIDDPDLGMGVRVDTTSEAREDEIGGSPPQPGGSSDHRNDSRDVRGSSATDEDRDDSRSRHRVRHRESVRDQRARYVSTLRSLGLTLRTGGDRAASHVTSVTSMTLARLQAEFPGMRSQAVRDGAAIRAVGQRMVRELARGTEQLAQRFQQARRARVTATTRPPGGARRTAARWLAAPFYHPVWRWVVVVVSGFALFILLASALISTIRGLAPW